MWVCGKFYYCFQLVIVVCIYVYVNYKGLCCILAIYSILTCIYSGFKYFAVAFVVFQLTLSFSLLHLTVLFLSFFALPPFFLSVQLGGFSFHQHLFYYIVFNKKSSQSVNFYIFYPRIISFNIHSHIRTRIIYSIINSFFRVHFFSHSLTFCVYNSHKRVWYRILPSPNHNQISTMFLIHICCNSPFSVLCVYRARSLTLNGYLIGAYIHFGYKNKKIYNGSTAT